MPIFTITHRHTGPVFNCYLAGWLKITTGAPTGMKGRERMRGPEGRERSRRLSALKVGDGGQGSRVETPSPTFSPRWRSEWKSEADLQVLLLNVSQVTTAALRSHRSPFECNLSSSHPSSAPLLCPSVSRSPALKAMSWSWTFHICYQIPHAQQKTESNSVFRTACFGTKCFI